MKIVIDKFEIEADKEHGYNLSETKQGKKGPYQLNYGWNMSLERCLLKIVHMNVASVDKELDLDGFLSLYKKETDRLVDLVNLKLNPSKKR